MKLNNLEFFIKLHSDEDEAKRLLSNAYNNIIYTNIRKVINDDKLSREVLVKVHDRIFNVFKEKDAYAIPTGSLYDYIISIMKSVIFDELLAIDNSLLLNINDVFFPFEETDTFEIFDEKNRVDWKNFLFIDTLTDIEIQVCKLYFQDQVSFIDIAKNLKISEDEVKEHYETGKNKIMEYYCSYLSRRRVKRYVCFTPEELDERCFSCEEEV